MCREVGATVTRNIKLRDTNVQVSATDEREIGQTAATVNGAALSQARRDKEAKYSELVASERCRFVVVALETGGRWSTEALEFVADMASSRARKGCTTGAATFRVSGVAEEVDKDAVSLVCQGIRDFVGCESHRRLGRR